MQHRPMPRVRLPEAFDHPDWLKIDRHGWTRSKQKWFECPAGAQVFEKGALQLPAKP